MVVSPTDPTKYVKLFMDDKREKNDSTWSTKIKQVVDKCPESDEVTLMSIFGKKPKLTTFKESGFDVYLYDTSRWYLLKSPSAQVEYEPVTHKHPSAFFVTSSKVGRQQRWGCCCSKGVTVRLPLDPGDDRNRRRTPCQTRGISQ
eukprot:GHVU01014347.1.p1 GENE.GHVU01014347.1~~GHVU01014347.1.p1  ORF type:complete len:145 (-),score=4.69 GHVU01014347.1:2-436(-)